MKYNVKLSTVMIKHILKGTKLIKNENVKERKKKKIKDNIKEDLLEGRGWGVGEVGHLRWLWGPYQDRTVNAGMAISRGLSGGGRGLFL